MELSEIYQPIAESLVKTEERIQQIAISNIPLVSQIAKHNLENPAKRIRSALVLFAARTGKPEEAKATELACALELVHTAALIHDDVIDGASVRRGKDTVSEIWGSKISVILGDYLLWKALTLIEDLKAPEIFSMVSSTLGEMIEGEIRQLERRFDFGLDQESYLEIARKKTASLFSCCCETGALLGGSTPEDIRALRDYGENVGLAFQIKDDCLDFVGGQGKSGKKGLKDIEQGDITLPLIRCLSALSPGEREEFVTAFESDGGDGRLSRRIGRMVVSRGGIEYALDVAQKHKTRAQEAIESLDKTEVKDSLIDLSEYMIRRDR